MLRILGIVCNTLKTWWKYVEAVAQPSVQLSGSKEETRVLALRCAILKPALLAAGHSLVSQKKVLLARGLPLRGPQVLCNVVAKTPTLDGLQLPRVTCPKCRQC